MPHSIRLRGPWRAGPLGRAVVADDRSWWLETDGLPPSWSAEVPADWSRSLGRDFRGLVRYKRQFHRPTGLDASSRVWLVIDDVDFQATVALNGQPLGVVQLAGSPPCSVWYDPHPSPLPEGEGRGASQPQLPHICPARFDITALLAPANELQLDVFLPPDSANLPRTHRHGLPGGLIGLVRLEIE